MTIVIIAAFIVGFAFLGGIIAAAIVNMHSYHKWRKEWYKTWRRP